MVKVDLEAGKEGYSLNFVTIVAHFYFITNFFLFT